jgi:hypothetical protein
VSKDVSKDVSVPIHNRWKTLLSESDRFAILTFAQVVEQRARKIAISTAIEGSFFKAFRAVLAEIDWKPRLSKSTTVVESDHSVAGASPRAGGEMALLSDAIARAPVGQTVAAV